LGAALVELLLPGSGVVVLAVLELLLLQADARETAASAAAAAAIRGRDMDRTRRIIVEVLPSDWFTWVGPGEKRGQTRR
jgi:hypothetical protein